MDLDEASTQVETAAQRKFGHRPALDGLRACAVIAVLAFHQDSVSALHLRGGFLGVDIFFVLSGFLITSLLVVEHGSTGGIALRSFWARRARRLLPALLLALLIVAAYCALVAAPADLSRIRADGYGTLLYIQNFRSILFGPIRPPLNHTWSLSIEEQWYLFWPIVLGALLVVTRSQPRRRAPIVFGVALLSMLWTYFLLKHGASFARRYYGTDTRAQSLLVGAALALMQQKVRRTASAKWLLEITGLAGAACIVYFVATSGLSRLLLYRGGLFLFALACAAVIAAAVEPESPILGRALSVRPLRAIGLISYGVYLYHVPVFTWLDGSRAHMHGLALLCLQLLVTFGVAIASFFWLEQPIRRAELAPRTSAVLAVVAVLATLGLFTLATS
jgi:peptidoglycan/LPS O-acetylase OafA/YrhL